MGRNYLDNPYKILFICLGNICRSPAAQGIMESMIAERGLARQDKSGLGRDLWRPFGKSAR